MPNSCRLLLGISILALAPVMSVAQDASAKLPDWAPKPRPNVIEDRLRPDLAAWVRSRCDAVSPQRIGVPPSQPQGPLVPTAAVFDCLRVRSP